MIDLNINYNTYVYIGISKKELSFMEQIIKDEVM